MIKKYISLFLAMVLAISLFACSGAPEEQQTEPPATEATEPQPTEPETVTIDNESKLNAALLEEAYALLEASLDLKTTVVVYEGELDGNGNTLSGPLFIEDMTDTHNTLAVEGGKIRNITLKGAYRCIGDTKEHPQMDNIYLENVTLDGETYALNFGYGDFTKFLDVENSTLLGWSSYTGVTGANFTGCTFGWDSTGTNGNLRPYVDTFLTGCVFEGKVGEDGSVEPFGIVLRENIHGITITLEDCYAGDVLITQENIYELLNIEAFDNDIYVSNTEQ